MRMIRVVFLVSGCTADSSPPVVSQPHSWSAPEPQPPPSTTETGSSERPAVLTVCDLQPTPPLAAPFLVDAQSLLWSTATGLPWTRLGYAVATVSAQGGGPDYLVTSAPGIGLPSSYSYYVKPRAEIWVFESPLAGGILERSSARSVLVGKEFANWFDIPYEGTVLTVGELTGDNQDDLVSAGEGILYYAPYHVIEMPPRRGARPCGYRGSEPWEFLVFWGRLCIRGRLGPRWLQ